jgi:putative sigma-54 modulation protein
MPIEITVRHAHAMDDMQPYARAKAEALMEEFPRVESLHVIMDLEKERHMAEILVQGRNHIRVGGKATTDNMRASLDAAADKVERQLRRLRDKIQDHKLAMKLEEEAHDRPETEA